MRTNTRNATFGSWSSAIHWALLPLWLIAPLTGCSFGYLRDDPPKDSGAAFHALSLPSLTISGMRSGAPGEEWGVIRGVMSLRAREKAPANGGHPPVPTGEVIQSMPVSFKVHGHSSQSWPKKSMGLELRDPSSPLVGLNVPLLGMPEENDYILHSLFSDKSLMRNLLVYRLAGEIQDWAPRTRLVELWGSQPDGDLSTDYQGIYLLCEKIKIDKGRVAVDKLTAADNAEPNVTGGYLLNIDWDSPDTWLVGTKTRNLAVIDPAASELTGAQRTWIAGYIEKLESCLGGTPVGDWRAFIDEASFIDFFLLNELFMNVDGYRLSTYMSKPRGGKIKAGPVWDFDLGSGNDSRSGFGEIRTWELLSQLDPGFNDQYPAFWWNEMLHDAAFRKALRSRWTQLRRTNFSDAHIAALIDSAVREAQPGISRNFLRYPCLTSNDDTFWTPMPLFGISTNPSQYTYKDHLDYFKNWMAARIGWMDSDAAWRAIETWVANQPLHLY